MLQFQSSFSFDILRSDRQGSCWACCLKMKSRLAKVKRCDILFLFRQHCITSGRKRLTCRWSFYSMSEICENLKSMSEIHIWNSEIWFPTGCLLFFRLSHRRSELRWAQRLSGSPQKLTLCQARFVWRWIFSSNGVFFQRVLFIFQESLFFLEITIFFWNIRSIWDELSNS